MKYIDMETWKRKDHYYHFAKMDYPHFNICGNVDITKFFKHIKGNDIPFFISVLYAASRTANDIKEFKYRIRENRVIEHETVSPSFTVMTDSEVFSFCVSSYTEDSLEFKNNTLREIEKVKNNICLEDEPGRDDLLFITSIPWVSFTSFVHPIQMNPVESIPRISWGKYFEESDRIKLPFSVQVHHALVDGLHVGEYFNNLQEILNNPAKYL
ncbi:MAG: CatA-like O-acetyltransferase [Acetivibrionales bacterium]